MKIGVLIWDLNISGGTQRQALELALNLQKAGHVVRVYSVYYDRARCYRFLLEQLNVTYLRVGRENYAFTRKTFFDSILRKMFIGWFRYFYYENVYRETLSLIDKDVDILCCHDCEVYPVGVKAREKLKAPFVWVMNDWPLPEPDLRGVKKLIRFLLSPFRGTIFFEWRCFQYIKRIEHIVVLDYLNKNKLRINYKINSEIIRNGVDFSHFTAAAKSPPRETLNILSNGIFFPWRRCEDLVEAARILREQGVSFEMHHIGTDERCRWYANKIYYLVEKYGLEKHFHFHGYSDEEQLVAAYQKADLFVFPNFPQTWGLAVFEAMACRTPVIVSRGCGASEVLTDGENALLVPPMSPQRIAEAVICLRNDPALWLKLSANGRQFVETNLRWDIYADKMLNLFHRILEGESIPRKIPD
ncbi:MAG: glycosyltransferase family 4 protein [Candidatus Omnitrophota bacterium]